MQRLYVAPLLLVVVGVASAAPPPARAAPAGAPQAHVGELAFSAQLVLAESLAPERATAPRMVPLSWQDGVASAVTPDGAVAVRLALATGAGGAVSVLTADAEWLKPSWTRVVGVELLVSGDRARVMGRDLRLTDTQAAVLERFDPKWVTVIRGGAPVASLVVADGLDAVRVQAAHGVVKLRLDLDSVDARPFVHDERCATRWRAPNRHLPSPARWHAAGDRAHARVQIAPGQALPLVKSRFPDGRRAAFAFTDHADQTTERTLEALAHAFIEHHLVLTKALFAHGTDRPQLDLPGVQKLADALAASGAEIVPHSATPRPDDRATTRAALARFARWHTRTWIDHQPETNCEAFGDQGWRKGGKFGIADLLADAHYDYVWAEVDAPPGELNLLDPKHLDQRAPTVWPLGRLEPDGPGGLWMFRTMWAFLEASHFYKLYAPERLDRLEKERGVHLAHTYLDTYHPVGTRFGLKNLLVPATRQGRPGGPGPVTVDRRFDTLLGDLERRQARGTLWVTTLGALADRLRATAEVEIRLGEGGSAILHAPRPLAGATFVVPAPVEVTLGGKAPRGLSRAAGETVFWDDLPAGDTVVKLEPKSAPPVAAAK